MCKHIWILFLLLSFFGGLKAQHLSYDAYRSGKRVGTLEVDRKLEVDGFEYAVRCHITVRVVVKIKLTFLFGSVYQNGILVRGYTRNLRDGKIRNESELHWEAGQYTMRLNAKERVLDAVVHQSATTLYLAEPSEGDQVLSERFGNWISISALGNHQYLLVHPNGSKNYYYYEAGRCVKIVIPHAMGDMEFRLVSESLL